MLLDLNMLAVFKIKYECEFDLKLTSYGSKSLRRSPQQVFVLENLCISWFSF